MRFIKKIFLRIIKKRGYKLIDLNKFVFGKYFLDDISFLIKKKSDLIIFDVGANIGQSTDLFKRWFSDSFVYSFEPNISAFDVLKKKYESSSSIHVFNFAVGAEGGEVSFYENSESDMSSILESGIDSWGELKSKYKVPVIALDTFCFENGIEFIDILKSDTQGFDFEVLKGARKMLKDNKISFIYFEFIFSDMYNGLPKFGDVFNFLTIENSYRLVSFYDFHYKDGKASWADVLFVSKELLNSSH